MKIIGGALLVSGISLGIYALFMNVATELPSQDFGYGVKTAALEVANVERIAQRLNLVVFSCAISIAGFFTLILPRALEISITKKTTAPTNPPMPPMQPSAQPSAEQGLASNISVSICPSCRFMGKGEDIACGRCGSQLA